MAESAWLCTLLWMSAQYYHLLLTARSGADVPTVTPRSDCKSDPIQHRWMGFQFGELARMSAVLSLEQYCPCGSFICPPQYSTVIYIFLWGIVNPCLCKIKSFYILWLILVFPKKHANTNSILLFIFENRNSWLLDEHGKNLFNKSHSLVY